MRLIAGDRVAADAPTYGPGTLESGAYAVVHGASGIPGNGGPGPGRSGAGGVSSSVCAVRAGRARGVAGRGGGSGQAII